MIIPEYSVIYLEQIKRIHFPKWDKVAMLTLGICFPYYSGLNYPRQLTKMLYFSLMDTF